MTDTEQQVRNRIALWRELITQSADDPGPSLGDLLNSLESDVRTLTLLELTDRADRQEPQ